MTRWQLQVAKARLSEVVQRAAAEGPQEITVRGEPVAVLVSRQTYERLSSPKPRFVDFLRQSPLVGAELSLERDRSLTRDVEL